MVHVVPRHANSPEVSRTRDVDRAGEETSTRCGNVANSMSRTSDEDCRAAHVDGLTTSVAGSIDSSPSVTIGRNEGTRAVRTGGTEAVGEVVSERLASAASTSSIDRAVLGAALAYTDSRTGKYGVTKTHWDAREVVLAGLGRSEVEAESPRRSLAEVEY